MSIKFIVLWTDGLLLFLVASIFVFIFFALRYKHWRRPWRRVFERRLGIVSFIILFIYLSIGVLDSIHFRMLLPGQTKHYSSNLTSLFDVVLSPINKQHEESYSRPFASHLFNKRTIYYPDGRQIQKYPRLRYGGSHLKSPFNEKIVDIAFRSIIALFEGTLLWFVIILFISFSISLKTEESSLSFLKKMYLGKTEIPWRLAFITIWVILFLITWIHELSQFYHIFGTDKIGRDVLYEALKSVRTGLIIGTLTTLIMLPFAALLGTCAGYFGGLIDDLIQYIYTTLSSIPAVLLIAAAILALQIYITNHPELFYTITERADARLLALCIILGITSWTTLCRLLRGETLKIREMDYIQAAKVLGIKSLTIIIRHVIPNVMHIILIAVVLDFSGLVLAEAVLSYVGVGVDPSMMSWGNMINAARLELSREPVVWWPLFAAFTFMFVLVLAANLFADTVRDAFDPRIASKT